MHGNISIKHKKKGNKSILSQVSYTRYGEILFKDKLGEIIDVQCKFWRNHQKEKQKKKLYYKLMVEIKEVIKNLD